MLLKKGSLIKPTFPSKMIYEVTEINYDMQTIKLRLVKHGLIMTKMFEDVKKHFILENGGDFHL